MKFKSLALAATASLALAATPASAAELLYSFSSNSGTGEFSFTLDSNPTPDFVALGNGIVFSNYSVTNPVGTEVVGTLSFYNSTSLLGGFDFQTPFVLLLAGYGPQLYSGTEASPTMLTGEFELFDPSTGTAIATLTVTEVNAAVPEPGTWAMMLMGFGAMGWSFKRRRKMALA